MEMEKIAGQWEQQLEHEKQRRGEMETAAKELEFRLREARSSRPKNKVPYHNETCVFMCNFDHKDGPVDNGLANEVQRLR